MASESFIHFPLSGGPEVTGSLQSPGKLRISYDPYRMKGTYLYESLGSRVGMIYMYIAFNGDTDATEVEMLRKKVKTLPSGGGSLVVDLTPITHTMNIPPGVWEIQIWFKGMTRSSMGWDSNDGNNYRFEVTKR